MLGVLMSVMDIIIDNYNDIMVIYYDYDNNII